ncbi:monovalent cation/H(+) antiporter subunit G [Paracoccus onubensis]|uniref:Cation:proton antiporter n=1 Tax=Paracoccus onubensis TaxID=1675788 RepID=A0A418T4S2_9RHOB|nr:monovalent cation/H(+) antiporter subunit G [Paracoccus onubensis]RJE88212.1 cation:proton antiporter [Paracoccus onubensis]
MTPLAAIPLWLALPIAFLVMLGATLTLIGAIGFLRLGNFYDRLHAPTLATSWGMGGIVLGSLLLATQVEGRIILHELVIAFAILITAPVTLMLLGRAALHRDRSEGSAQLPESLRQRRSPETAENSESDE